MLSEREIASVAMSLGMSIHPCRVGLTQCPGFVAYLLLSESRHSNRFRHVYGAPILHVDTLYRRDHRWYWLSVGGICVSERVIRCPVLATSAEQRDVKRCLVVRDDRIAP